MQLLRRILQVSKYVGFVSVIRAVSELEDLIPLNDKFRKGMTKDICSVLHVVHACKFDAGYSFSSSNSLCAYRTLHFTRSSFLFIVVVQFHFTVLRTIKLNSLIFGKVFSSFKVVCFVFSSYVVALSKVYYFK